MSGMISFVRLLVMLKSLLARANTYFLRTLFTSLHGQVERTIHSYACSRAQKKLLSVSVNQHVAREIVID